MKYLIAAILVGMISTSALAHEPPPVHHRFESCLQAKALEQQLGILIKQDRSKSEIDLLIKQYIPLATECEARKLQWEKELPPGLRGRKL